MQLKEKYNLANDSAQIFDAASKGRGELEKIDILPGRPLQVMLAVKADDISDAFRICGKPAVVEYKYDGFRVLINKDKTGKISLFTRRLENVTNQFPDVVSVVSSNIKGDSFILDSEVVGFDSNTGKYMPFEAISQRIRRKYDIDKLVEELPVEIDVFDVIYYNGKNLMNEPYFERRKIVEKMVKEKEWKIKPSVQKIVKTEEEALEFYERALKVGEEGIMVKNLEAVYQQGRRVGYWVKMKPQAEDLDLAEDGVEATAGAAEKVLAGVGEEHILMHRSLQPRKRWIS